MGLAGSLRILGLVGLFVSILSSDTYKPDRRNRAIAKKNEMGSIKCASVGGKRVYFCKKRTFLCALLCIFDFERLFSPNCGVTQPRSMLEVQ
jgi:hypothetical protein